MSLSLTKVKAQITIQDIGRWGYQSSGVPISGPMDKFSFRNANLIVGNNVNAACMEIGIGSVEISITKTSLISLCGNAHQLTINDIKVDQNKAILCNEGCTLTLKPTSTGVWSYLSIGGGFEIQNILGSQSTYLTSGFGGFDGRALKAGDELSNKIKRTSLTERIIQTLVKTKNDFVEAKWFVSELNKNFDRIRIITGPEWDWLSSVNQEKLTKQSYTVSNDSNRMGYRLKSVPIARRVKDEMISSGVSRGTVQLTNDGSLIVLMADSQTVGGYPRIAQVAAVDIPKLAQTKPGTDVKFELISNSEAENLLLEQEQDFRKLKAGIQFKVL